MIRDLMEVNTGACRLGITSFSNAVATRTKARDCLNQDLRSVLLLLHEDS
ncbi:hypothetical protein H6F98_02190 [Microcoleus sp. FACHB-SPT15]|nr:hypothetical protein [Microcoleus sp. FACHB-SPT15]MBD1804284.1 hypothetical protein [Microcoleus sp. FACHB-SPT15]